MGSEPLFPLHHRWEVMPLGEVCRRGGGNVQTGPFGSQLHASDYVSDGIPSVMPQNIGDNKILYTGIAKITREDAERLSKYRMREGDIVYSRRGDVERRALVRKTEDGWLCGTGCLRIRFGDEVVYPRYAAHYLGHPSVREWIVRHAHGATMPNLNTTILSELPFVLPPWSAQVLIGDAIEAYDRKLDLNRRINQTLEAMAQAIFQSWFVNFDPVKAKVAAIQEGRDPLRAAMTAVSGKADAELDALPPEQYEQLAATAALFPGEMEASELGEIPKGWSHKALLQLTDKIGSGSTPRGGKEVYLEEGVALIRSQNVYDSLFAWDGLARISDEAAAQLKGVTVQEEDVLLNITGASILRTCVVEPDVLPARVNQHVAIIRAKAGVPPRFIHMHLLRPDIKNYLLGLNAGASREAITKAHIESLVLLTPGPELLSAFQTAISPLFRQVHCLTRQMRALGELRDTLLPKLLSGELPVTEAMVEAVA